MTANTKTPLQAVVSVICDCLCELPPEDQVRTLEAVRVTLGLRAAAPTQDHNPFQKARAPLPTVEVQMVSDHPVVVNPPTDPETPRQRFVVAGPLRVTVRPPQQQPHRIVQGAARGPGYVRLSWRDRYERP
jgi:hypothetical protein